MPNDKFCVRPFMHSLVDTAGRFRVCCRIDSKSGYNINKHTVEEWWNSNYLNDIRDRMRQGKDLPECWRCHKQEEHGATSFRETSNQEWADINNTTNFPIDWEIQITNLCNLKCMMCNPWSSSQILVEENKIFEVNWDQKNYDWDESSADKVRSIFEAGESFVIRGGEPFMVPWLKRLVREISSKKSFLINTNATRFDREWFDILSGHDVRMSVSIDAVGELNHYIRYPSKWQDIIDNLDMMRKLPNANVFLNTCVQNLNVLHLDKLINWASSQDLFVNFDVLTSPKHFQPSCLPVELAELARNRLASANDSNSRGLSGIINFLSNPDTSYWDEFVRQVQIRDRHRGVDIVNYVPEMEPYFA